MKTTIEIIDETAGAYTLSTRAVVGDTTQCVYQNAEGRCCAVGRCMKDPLSVENSFNPDDDNGVTSVAKKFESLDATLKPEYRGHPEEFWEQLQGLHDDTLHWDEEGLSVWGKEKVNSLKLKWEVK